MFFFLLKNLPVIFQKSLTCPEIDFETIKKLHLPSISGNIHPRTIDQLLDGKLFTLNHDHQKLINFEEKTRDIFFSKISCSPDDPDIRVVWEPARLQYLTTLIHKFSGAPNPENKKIIRSLLLKWLDDNQFPRGPHYMSVMECGIRIPVFLQALQTLDTLTDDEQRTIYQTIFQHGWLIRKRLSLYSSLGNHTVAECLGLLMAGSLFRNSSQGREWLATGIRILEQEALHQILADGGPAEQSFSYHRFVLDLFWLATDFMEKNALHDCIKLRKRLILGEKFLTPFFSPDGRLPHIGDSDDGQAVAIGLHPKQAAHEPANENITSFPDSGYTIIRNADGLRLTFAHGPLGMAPLFNHGHADCLSITLALGEYDFLTDPGTFQYNGDRVLRSYFKGTSAHNTVCIDGQDQAEQLTGFVWDRSFNVEHRRHTTPDGYEVSQASHDGYTRLNHPAIHQRKIISGPADIFLLEDIFKGTGCHDFALNYHLHPQVEIEFTDNWYCLKNKDREIYLQLIDGNFELIQGQKNPLLGWYSPAYGVIEETTTLQAKQTGAPAEVRFSTLITIGKPNPEAIKNILAQR